MAVSHAAPVSLKERTMRHDSERAPVANLAVLPGQMPGGQRVDAETFGVRALLLAILEDAARCIARGRQHLRRRDRNRGTEAEMWVRSDDRTSPFSFVNISDALGIDTDGLREHLLQRGLVDRPRS